MSEVDGIDPVKVELPAAPWRMWWQVFKQVFWRDVIYAILPLIVSFIITAIKGGDFAHLFQSAEWLFAAIVFLGLSIAQLDRRREMGLKDKPNESPTTPLLFLVIVAAVLLGLSLWQRQSENPAATPVSQGHTWLLPSAQLCIALYALYRLWKLAYEKRLEEVRWEDSLNSDPPQLPKDMSPKELIGNIGKNLRVARDQMALLGRAVSAEKQVRQIAARNPDAWDTAATNLQAEIRAFIKLSELLEESLSSDGSGSGTRPPKQP